MMRGRRAAMVCLLVSGIALAGVSCDDAMPGVDAMMNATTDAMNATMNMTMNSTDMANDTITETAGGVEPVSDDGRRRLQQSLSDAVSGAVDNAKETASGAVDKAKDVAGKAVDKTNEVITNVN